MKHNYAGHTKNGWVTIYLAFAEAIGICVEVA